MVWYGMVWYGMVWYGTVRYGTGTRHCIRCHALQRVLNKTVSSSSRAPSSRPRPRPKPTSRPGRKPKVGPRPKLEPRFGYIYIAILVAYMGRQARHSRFEDYMRKAPKFVAPRNKLHGAVARCSVHQRGPDVDDGCHPKRGGAFFYCLQVRGPR